MKRIKLWWAGLTAEERRELWEMERGVILTDKQMDRLYALIDKADNAVRFLNERGLGENENPTVLPIRS